MPKVTLLAEAHKDYSLHFGGGLFQFLGGKPLEVPVAVALHCSKQKHSDGACKFDIGDMPEVVDCMAAPPVEQNVVEARHLFSQPKLFESSICL